MKGYTIQHSIELLEKQAGSGSSGGGTATDVSYSNTSSGLNAINVQSAIDELDGIVDVLLNGHIYSETEKVIGKWIDGSDLYEKVVPISAFPSTPYTATNYAHGISNIDKILDVRGAMTFSTGTTYMVNTPMFGGSGQNPTMSVAVISAYADKTNVVITTAVDRSAGSGFVVLTYTKTAAQTNTRKRTKKIEEE